MAEGLVHPDDVFNAARRLNDPAARGAYLDEACAGDANLRQRVEALLDAHEAAGSFLESPAAEMRLGATMDQAALPLREAPGAVVGPYKLLQQIGEGGMGVVFLAEQTRPVRRQVALKVIKLGMDTRQVVARFEAERQALALMDHPNIAKVLDAGATESGRPYFVMELVKGVPITRYCDEHRLTPKERLGLFVQVCLAVQHAHQKGIIHRDLKPSNILIALYDGKPVPKVIDFGVAKATGGRLTEATLFTGFGAMVGTPEYMSPEQAELNQLDVDTRSDVYSLGVLLYELLTGSTPVERGRFKQAALLEVLRVVREEEPPRPSTRLSTTDQLPSIAASRGLEPRKLSGIVRGELDWIVMRALEKDRTRRYETANGLARDVERYLTDEPVHACPPSGAYKLRKFARRNRGALVAASIALLFLVLVGGGAGWVVRDRSVRRATLAELVGRGLEDSEAMYRQGKLPEAVAAAEKAHGLLLAGGAGDTELGRQASEWLAELDMAARLEDWHTSALDRADELETVAGYARAFREYGIDVEALTSDEAAAAVAARRIRLDLALALDRMAVGRKNEGADPARWRRLLEIARTADPDPWRDRLRDLVGRTDAGGREALLRLAETADPAALPPRTWMLLVSALEQAGERDAAIAANRQALQRHPGDFRLNNLMAHILCGQDKDPRDPVRAAEAVGFAWAAVAIRPRSSGAHNTHGIALFRQGRLDEAAAAYREAIRLKPDHYDAHNNLGVVLIYLGKPAEAAAAFREAIRIKPRSSTAHTNLGAVLDDLGKLDEAVAAQRKAIELEPDHSTAYNNLGTLLVAQKKVDEGIVAYRKAIELDPKNALAYNNLGYALWGQKKLDEAIAAYRKAIELDPKECRAHINLGSALHDRKQFDEAIACFRKVIELDPKCAPTGYFYLGNALSAQKKRQEAVAVYRKVIELDPKFAPAAYFNLANTLRAQQKLEEAVAAYRKAIELEPKNAGAYNNLAVTLLDQRKPNEAVAAYTKAIELEPNNVGFHSGRAAVYAALGQWDKSAADYERSAELDPKNHEARRLAAYARLAGGDTAGYRRACAELVERFGQTDDPIIAERTAKVCSAAPEAIADFGRVERLAQRAVTGTEKHGYHHYFVLARGLTECRAGRHAEAVEWLKRFAPNAGRGADFDAIAFAALAMAQHRLGQTDEAKASLAKAKAIVAQKMPDPAKGRPFTGNWHDWLHAQILSQEAEDLLGTESRPAE